MKKTKIFLALIVLVSMVLVGAFASGSQEEETTAPASEEVSSQPFIAAMATDVGGLGDKSFNDGAYGGIEMAATNLGVVDKVVESKQQTDYVPNLSGLAEDGANMVFAVGFLMEQAVTEAATNNPDTYFAGIDIAAGDASPENFMGIVFNEHEAGYLAGVVAGLMTKDYASASDKLNDDNVIGVVLGMFIPAVEKYEVGYIAGAKSVNPDIEVLSATAGDFTDQAKGKELALAMIEQGADIVFHAAGLTGLGAINACSEEGCLAIGVDVDQNAVAPDTVLTSAEKKIVQATYLAIESAVNGTFQGGTKVFGINDDAVGISDFHSFDSVVPQEVKDAVADAVAKMKAGEIAVPTTREELAAMGY
ncbi:MAG: BMP family ABC transporter substrate-binding protein [Spirochaetales bacterium]|nr:BMP family ABC transporter substrate-binding protein [Spirochaetales bacterium]